jgi:ABC-type multidrug transport system permease subunit
LAKLIPFWVVGFVVLTLSFGLAWLIYGILPVGSLGIIYLLSALFVLVMSGFGLVISNHSATMQQAMFVMFFFIIISLLMSGLFTPVTSMPQWAQIITILNPLKRFFNTGGMLYRELGVKDRLTDMSEGEQLELLAAHPMLVKRPILVANEAVLVGFDEVKWAEVVG